MGSDQSDLKNMQKLVVSEERTRGDVTFGPGCIIHPSASIIAEAGPIIFGAGCIVKENAQIIYSAGGETLKIGTGNIFEVSCTVKAHKIGNGNIFGNNCFVGSRVKVNNGCIIGAGVSLKEDLELADGTIIYNPSGLKIMASEDRTMRGDITIGPGCIIDPSASIIAEAGPIIIGAGCIVKQNAQIIYSAVDNAKSAGGETLKIGTGNIFEVSCTVKAHKIGNGNIFGNSCFVGSRVKVNNGCIIGASVKLDKEIELADGTIVSSQNNEQQEAIEKQNVQY